MDNIGTSLSTRLVVVSKNPILKYCLSFRNKSPSSSNNIADLIEDRGGQQQHQMNGNADQHELLHHHHLPSINEITNNVTTAKKHVVENCDSGWGVDSRLTATAAAVTTSSANNSSIKDSYKADLFEEDDLGFDPFHETQKALAEMLESESKQQQQQQQQQQQHRHLYQQQQSAPPFTHQRQTNESPPLQNLRNHESPVMNRNPAMMGGLRGFSNDMGNHLNNTSGAAGRVKQPPPGFAPDPLSTLLGSGTNGQQQNSQRSLLSPGKAFFLWLRDE